MKLDHIAVVLRGHVRTWHYIYPMVFDFYDSIAENVDYYFVTWDTSNTDGIVETFKGGYRIGTMRNQEAFVKANFIS